MKRISILIAMAGAVLAISLLSGPYLSTGKAQGTVGSDVDAPASNRGPFTLVDHDGQPVTERAFLGTYMLVFFGYTHCPDVCPTDLQTMSIAMDMLGTAGEKVQPIFITIDPERDSVETMAAYVGNFHPRLVGLTGTRAQVAAAATVYGVRFRKFYPWEVDDDGGDGDSENQDGVDYLMDHSASIYLIGPDGGGLSRYPHGILPEDIAADVREFMKSNH